MGELHCLTGWPLHSVDNGLEDSVRGSEEEARGASTDGVGNASPRHTRTISKASCCHRDPIEALRRPSEKKAAEYSKALIGTQRPTRKDQRCSYIRGSDFATRRHFCESRMNSKHQNPPSKKGDLTQDTKRYESSNLVQNCDALHEIERREEREKTMEVHKNEHENRSKSNDPKQYGTSPHTHKKEQ